MPLLPQNLVDFSMTGSTINFGGRYWLVLDTDGDYAKFLHLTVITNQPYHHTNEVVTWETSSSREWLNGEFYNSFAGRNRIRETYVVNDDNQAFVTPGGNNTTDRIFSLSIDEAQQHFADNDARIARSDTGEPSWWWLRSPGTTADTAAGVNYGGPLSLGGNIVNSSGTWGGLRPAMWVRM
jgi:hypothetical protein